MSLPTDPGTIIPTLIQEYDGFDTDVVDPDRWETPTENGSTLITQAGGKALFTNAGSGTAGISRLQSIRKFGKNWRISVDIKMVVATGVYGAASLVLYKDANNWIRIGPYKTAELNNNCYLRYMVDGVNYEALICGNAVDVADCHVYTIGVIPDTILVYLDGQLKTSFPFKGLNSFYVMLEAGTYANSDTILAEFDDYELYNHIDTMQMTIGALVRGIYDNSGAVDLSAVLDAISDLSDKVGTSIVTDVSGTLVIDDASYHYITFDKATYGKKFRLNLFGDLENQEIDYCYLFKTTGSVWTDQSAVANTIQTNTVLLKPSAGSAIGDCIYFGNDEIFKRLDVYMAQGTSNTNNVYVWEGWTGAAWVTLTATDGTLYNSKVFGTSGKVTFTNVLAKTTINGINAYWIRARITTVGTSNPIASHIQVTEDAATGFDGLAAFLSNLSISIFRKRTDGSYAELPSEVGLPYTQCILYRNVAITDLPCWTDVIIGFKLSATPTASISIPYNGYVETIEAN